MACRLVSDYYAPIVPPSDYDMIAAILSELHASSLGGHLSFKKMF